MSDAVKVAKLIRQELKKHGIHGSVRKSSFDCVRVTITDELPATRDAIESFCSQFKLGHFDGMTDCYEYSNTQDDIPQVKFIFVTNTFTNGFTKSAEEYVEQNYNTENWTGYECQQMARKVLVGCEDSNFWYQHKQRAAA